MNTDWNAIKGYYNNVIDGLGDDNIKRMFDSFPEFYQLPASVKYHGSFEGGLATHTYFVIRTALDLYRLMISYDTSKTSDALKLSIIKTALLHDIGKLGQLDNNGKLIPAYIKSGTLWMYNDKIPLKLEHELQSLQFCNYFDIKLTTEETMVIYHHAGAYSSSHQYINDNQSVLQIIIHQADNFCAKVLNV